MASTYETIKEIARQRAAEDENFLGRYLYFFEMQVPFEVSTVGGFLGFLFPLILPPEAITVTEPFATESTATQGAGLYVEENGIIRRTIQIRGNTGFKPRQLKVRVGDAFPATLPPDKKSFSRSLPETILDKISGQRHFQYLQDSVFRTYADLKRDPATSEGTKLIFHNPRDQESWFVVPEKFVLNRDKSQPLLYRYDIELTAVDKATAARASFSPDKSVFDALKDALSTMRRGVALVTGAVNDLTALVGEIRSFVNQIDDILDSAADILDAVSDFVDGVTTLVEIPYVFVETLIDTVESAQGVIDSYNNLVSSARSIPETISHKFARLQDGLELIAVNATAFEMPLDEATRQKREQQEQKLSISANRKSEALNSSAPTTFDDVRALGTQLTPGDAEEIDGELSAGALPEQYRSAREVRIEEGDTLAGLAARYLGDARLWEVIAILNGLKPPFIDSQADAPLVGGSGTESVLTGSATGADERPFSGVLGIGSKILIPSKQRSIRDLPTLPVLGVPATESAESQFFGTDIALESTTWGRPEYDIAIDTDHGSVDIKTTVGVQNIIQVLRTHLLTDRGSDPLYRNIGLQKIIGMNMAAIDLEIARFRLIDAVSSDPRVSSVKHVELTQGLTDDVLSADQLRVVLEVYLRGLNQAQSVELEF